jgi:hypothetical protein
MLFQHLGKLQNDAEPTTSGTMQRIASALASRKGRSTPDEL